MRSPSTRTSAGETMRPVSMSSSRAACSTTAGVCARAPQASRLNTNPTRRGSAYINPEERMSEQANVSLVLSLYEAFRRGDIPTILNSLDAQVSWEVEAPPAVPYSGIFRGPEQAAQFFTGIGTTMD